MPRRHDRASDDSNPWSLIIAMLRRRKGGLHASISILLKALAGRSNGSRADQGAVKNYLLIVIALAT